MNNRKYLWIIVIVGLIIFFISFARSFYKSFQEGYVKSQVSSGNTNIAGGLNSNLPMMVDSETRLDNVLPLPNNTLQYNYTLVKTNIDSIDIPLFTKNMTETLKSQIKENPQIEPLRETKTSFSYYYKDKNDKFITQITITPDMYN